MTSADKIFIYINEKRTSLADFMAMEKSKIVSIHANGCTALTELKADAAEYVDARGCTALTELKADAAKINRSADYIFAGVDSRGYTFEGITVRGQWRVIAGCQNKSIAEARAHWGPGGNSDRPDCLALVEKIAAFAAQRTRGHNVGEQVDS